MSSVNLDTEVSTQINKRKKVKSKATVIEAFKEKYIKVILHDEDDHVFELKWNGFMYEGKMLDMSMTCLYNVEKDFSAVKTTHGTGYKSTIVRRSKSGRPVSMTN